MTDEVFPDMEFPTGDYLERHGYQVVEQADAAAPEGWWTITAPDGTAVSEDDAYEIAASGLYREAVKANSHPAVTEMRPRTGR